jgi:hypothetical protein
MDERAAIQWLILTKELAFIIVNAPDFDHAIHLRKPIHLLAISATTATGLLPRQLR